MLCQWKNQYIAVFVSATGFDFCRTCIIFAENRFSALRKGFHNFKSVLYALDVPLLPKFCHEIRIFLMLFKNQLQKFWSTK